VIAQSVRQACPSEKDLLDANRLAQQIGWQAAIGRILPERADLVCAPRRADFQYLWDLPTDAFVLSAGDDWGAIAAALGRHFAHVTAVEDVFERARFIDIRARQTNAAVEALCADLLFLPLAPGQFDAVVLNAGLACPANGATRDFLLRLLRSLRDLLKPSGFLCLNARNRWGWPPRGSGRGFTLSLAGYRQLLREAGFGAVRAFHPWDGSEHPGVLLPLDHAGALIHYIEFKDFPISGWRGEAKRLALRAAARTGLWAYLAPEFMFLAENA